MHPNPPPPGATEAGKECLNSDPGPGPGPIGPVDLLVSAVGGTVERARERKERHVPQEAAM